MQMANANGGQSGGLADQWMNHSIVKVPLYIRHSNPKAYTPNVVSIGPYHNGEPHLVDMEEHKRRALQHLVGRSNKSEQDFKYELLKYVRSLKSSYNQMIGDQWKSDNSFLSLMILDGAFLYEFLNCFNSSNYNNDDPVFSYYALVSLCPYIIPDIFMIENQLPLKVLERLIAVEKGKLDELHYQEVHKLVFKLLGQKYENVIQASGYHVLDVARKSISKQNQQGKEPSKPAKQVLSVSDLSDAGVSFGVSAANGASRITFDHGVLNLVPLCMDTFTEPLFLNSTTFERLRPTVGRQVSSYIAFMAGLIRTPADVSLLRSQQLIEDRIGSDEEVARVVGNISKNVFFDPYSNLCQVRDSLNDYHGLKMKAWRRKIRGWKRKFMQKYFDNPWTVISLVAGVAILLLTAVQTFYTVLGYYKNTN